MKGENFRKVALATVVTLSTASIYFAQSVKDSVRSKDIEAVVLTGVADIAKDRKTPVAVSTIKASQIVEKLGNQEFPEILNTTPSVYATKSGGGFGDARINIRGFAQENVAVTVNGMPVNDMENGSVYWSNWAGLSDVTSAMQVQRGLGASKLAIASVGGTINIVSRAADKKQQGIVMVGVANNDYHKSVFSYNTGKNKKGWSASFLMGRTAGAMYADGTDFEGYNYYLALGYQPNKKHDFQITFTGAPQWHQQRRNQVTIADYLAYGSDGKPNRRYNGDWGYLNGKKYSWWENYYHKPVAMFNWNWKIDDSNDLATVVYGSWGRGGGGTSPLVARNLDAYRLADGQLSIDQMVADNMASPAKPKILRRSSVNQHDWYGFLTNFTHKFNTNLKMSLGLDGRYYKGMHYQVLTDLLGASSYTDTSDKSLANPTRVITATYEARAPWNPFSKVKHEAISYHNDGKVLWGGIFGQLEYTNDRLSAFFQGSLSNQSFQRIDYFLKPGTLAISKDPNSKMSTKTGFKSLFGFNLKTGANYNINEHHNVFANVGYYERQPFFNAVYPNNKNYLNPNLTNEKIFGTELGYSFRSRKFNANLNLYRTHWGDRVITNRNRFTLYDYNSTPVNGKYPELKDKNGKVETVQGTASIFGITQIHYGVEMDMQYKINELLSLTGMFSMGQWEYKGNVSASYFDDSNNPILGADQKPVEQITLYLDGVKVGNSAQTTASLGVTVKPVKNLSFNADWRYVDNLYSAINPSSFTEANHKGSLKLPSYNLMDLGFSYKLQLNNRNAFTFRGSIYNLFDTIYIAESRTNTHLKTEGDFATSADYENYLKNDTYKGIDQSNQVFFGFGRTWSASLSFTF